MIRKATLIGGAFTVLFLAAVLVMQNFDFLPSQAEAIGFFEERGRSITWGAFLGGVASFCLIWFGALLARRLQSNAASITAGAALGGSIFAAVTTALGLTFLVAGAERTVLGGGVSPEVAAILYDLASVTVGNMAPFGFALLTGAVVVGGRKHFPAWFVWVSGVLTIGLISPINYAVVALVLLWIPASGIWIDRATKTEKERV